MQKRRFASKGPRRLARRVGLAAGAGALSLLGVGASAPAVVPAVSHVLSMQPAQSTSVATVSGRGSGKASSNSSPCWASSNWSGYAVSTKTPAGLSCVPASGVTYSSVSATYTVPTVTGSSSSQHPGLFGGFGSSSSSTYSAVWTGIDGFTDDDLIQAGTEQDYSGGRASYSAWWEILPAAETTIPSITVDPGDSITVTIAKQATAITTPVACSAGQWLISLNDTTADAAGRGSAFSTCKSYSGPADSAEWIVEAPEVNGRIATLADYATATFGYPGAVLTVNGSPTDLTAGTGGEMEQSSGVVSVPSSPTGGDAFTCAYGSSVPSPPA